MTENFRCKSWSFQHSYMWSIEEFICDIVEHEYYEQVIWGVDAYMEIVVYMEERLNILVKTSNSNN
jgi:hypothetical protein